MPAPVKLSLVIAGSLAQRPHHGGHAWVFLQYLLGFRRLGWDVLFLDSIAPDLCADEAGQRCEPAQSLNVRRFREIMTGFGLAENCALFCGGEIFGLPRKTVVERVRSAEFLLNVMGFLRDEDVLAAARRRVFLDIDPGFGQIWCELGLSDIFAGHDAFVTIGERIGTADCAVPRCGFDWITTPQPVVLDQWPACNGAPPNFTSVASWRGPFGPIEYRGQTYGLRVHEFRKFAQLPRQTGARFELALDIHSAEVNDLALLRENGWQLVDPVAAAGDTASYRRFVQQSRAELMVAKNLYVETGGGWFSDRSICYLASGRPVLAQRTGWTFPEGCGLVGFSTLEEAIEGVQAIDADYAAHSRRAREIACECFDSDKVLGALLEKLNAA